MSTPTTEDIDIVSSRLSLESGTGLLASNIRNRPGARRNWRHDLTGAGAEGQPNIAAAFRAGPVDTRGLAKTMAVVNHLPIDVVVASVMVGVRDSGLMNMENESLSPAVKKVSRIKRAFSNAPSVLALTIPQTPVWHSISAH